MVFCNFPACPSRTQCRQWIADAGHAIASAADVTGAHMPNIAPSLATSPKNTETTVLVENVFFTWKVGLSPIASALLEKRVFESVMHP